MAKKRVTRKKVNDPIVDNALRDIYDKIDSLQPQSSEYKTSNPPITGEVTVVTDDTGNTTMAAYTENGWLVDINSNFQPVASPKGYVSALGIHGKSRTPVHGEAVKYDKDHALPISNHKKDKVLLKNVGGLLNVRNADDSADADVRCASIKDSNGNKVLQVTAVTDSKNFVKAFGSIEENAFGPTLVAEGSDDNIPLTIMSKGTGTLYLTPTSGLMSINLPIIGIRFTFDAANVLQKFHGTAQHLGVIKCETDGEFQIYNLDANTDTSAAHIKIASSDDLYLASGGGEIFLSSGGASAGSMDLGTEFGKFKGAGGSYLTHTATATSTGYKVDSNLSGNSASNGTGLHIDFDRTVAGSGTAAHTDRGIDVEVNSASLGTGTAIGVDISVLGATSGTSTTIGTYIDTAGADTNIGMFINTSGTHIHMAASADAATDYGTIAVADTGDMTITTFGDGSADSDLTLDPDGDLIITTDHNAGQTTIDKNLTNTATATNIGMQIDVDRTGISASGQTMADTGLDIDMNCESVTHVGTVNQTGIDIDLVAATDGTQTNTGINISCTGADTNTHLQLSHDATNYCRFRTIADGATTIATTDSDGTGGNLVLDADGNIDLDVVGKIFFKKNTAFLGAISAGSGVTSLQLFENEGASISDYCQISVAEHGATTISTVDAAGVLGTLTLDAHGILILDSHSGRFVAKNAGTEFSAASSAYAGMILGYTRIANDGTSPGNNVISIDTSSMTVLQTAQGTNVSISFTVPPSGKVEIQCSFWMAGTSDGVNLSLSTATSYSELDETHTYDADQTIYLDETDHNYHTVSFSVTGLSPGGAINWYIAALASGAGMYIGHGRNRASGSHFPPIIVKAIALPNTIVEGE